MELYKIIVTFSVLGYIKCRYTDYTVLLWLSSDARMSPTTVWSQSNSPFNDNTNATIKRLLKRGILGYRNTFIDKWADNPPDKVRVTYRNKNGTIISKEKFNTTGSSSMKWFAASNLNNAVARELTYELSHSYTSYSVDFATLNKNLGVARYKSACLKLANNGDVYYIVGSGDLPALLQATPTAPEDCFMTTIDGNEFTINFTIANLTHDICSAQCREFNCTQCGVHGDTCSCIGQPEVGPILNEPACTIPCDGNVEEMCGGISPIPVIFNSVNTDIDVLQFNEPLISLETIQITGNSSISLQSSIHLNGFNLSISANYTPLYIRMVLNYKAQSCNDTDTWNSTHKRTFEVPVTDSDYPLQFEPLFVQCMFVSLYYNTTKEEELTVPVNITLITTPKNRFITAQYFTVEAAWLRVEDQAIPVEEQTTDDTKCQCSCFVYNLLYGNSTFNNMSYEEIQVALKNVTDKLEKELAVNKTALSSTKRKKTSAKDKRSSAAAVGYCLGVALLVTSLGAIFLADIPKLLESFNILRGNLKSRFGKQNKTEQLRMRQSH